MKKPTRHISQHYPYLAYFIEEWGEMTITDGNWGRAYLALVDMGGNVYDDYETKDHEEALQKAEKFLREIDFPSRMDKETIEALEEEYQELGLK
jgi:hypothetical protein